MAALMAAMGSKVKEPTSNPAAASEAESESMTTLGRNVTMTSTPIIVPR